MESSARTREYRWYPWECRGYPFSAAEEQLFVAELAAAAAGRRATFRRGHVSVVMDALHSGFPAAQLAELLPGVSVCSLFTAYEHTRGRLDAAVAAWRTYLDDPHECRLADSGDVMAALLPVPFSHVMQHLQPVDEQRPATSLPEVLTGLRVRLADTSARIAALEQSMASSPSLTERRRIGARLFNPLREHEWQDPFFMPSRVGQLSAMRLSDLLQDAR